MINKKLSCLQSKNPILFKSSYTKILESKLSSIRTLSTEYIDEKLSTQGVQIIQDLIPHISPEKGKKNIETLDNFTPKNFEQTITHSGFYKNIPCSHPYLDEIKDFYKKLFGLDLLKYNLSKTLEYLKNSDVSPETITKAKKELNYLGLKPEIKELIDKAKDKLGTQVEFPNIRSLAKSIYEKLEMHKKLYGSIPTKIKMNDIGFYIENPVKQRSLATYIPDMSRDKTTPSMIIFNPIKTFTYIISDLCSELGDSINHELGHHTHCESLGFKKWNELSFFDLFDENEKQVINKLFKSFKDEKFETMNDFQKTEMACNWACYTPLDENSIKVLQKISTKLNSVKGLIEETYGDYALTNPKELVAEAFRYSNYADPPDELKKILKFFNMPELKDRSNLPKTHPVMKMQE